MLYLSGAMRSQEVYNLTPQDVVIGENDVNITIRNTKTGMDRLVKIMRGHGKMDPVGILQRYDAMAKLCKDRRAFLMGIRNMKVTSQRLGINRLKLHFQDIATFLQLPDVKKYTSHSGRRTATTVLANRGATNVQLKKVGGWTNMSTVEGYIA